MRVGNAPISDLVDRLVPCLRKDIRSFDVWSPSRPQHIEMTTCIWTWIALVGFEALSSVAGEKGEAIQPYGGVLGIVFSRGR